MSSRQKITLSFTLIFVLLILGLGYYYWFHLIPLKDRVEGLTQSIKSEEVQISQLEKDPKSTGNELANQTAFLQQMLPVAPILDQFILDLEKAEISSGSLITSFSFNENQSVAQNETLSESDYKQSEELSVDLNFQNDNTKDEIASEPRKFFFPEGIERLTVSMIVEAPSYIELEAFIKAIEDLQRLTQIDSLAFTGNREVREAGKTVNKLIYSVTVSAFYYPTLEELKDQLPKYELPSPANKTNPLYPFAENKNDSIDGVLDNAAEYPSENLGTLASKVVEKNGNSYIVYIYEVKPGDTLFSLAIKYYNNRDGEDTIKEWNGITRLLSGETIEMPFLLK
ncbi:LysM peptidoglycan-binding domain-containing protein [Cytobacillus oceanisediminis]|uniref:LysM peptidoglycan-binding domain-containing protein n=1 Tax=Cytobacillus oceanisediminis TaxID=665099 RepID=UPI003735B688